MRAMNGLKMLPFAVGRGADPADRRSQYPMSNIQCSMFKGNSRTMPGATRRATAGSVVGRGADPAGENQHPTSNIQHPMTNETDRRRGVALIIVLGFLTIMVLMAVAFLTQARVERMVADSTLEAMRGRQLMRTAMNAAMNDYSTYLWEEQLNVPSRDEDKMFTSTPPTSASGMGGRTIGADGVELLAGEALDWVPRRYTNAPFNAIDEVNDAAQWILVREDPTKTDENGRILGRYAYVCFDMSGGIDANLIARSEGVAAQDTRSFTNRVRYSVRDVPMALLPETADANEFKRLREGWKGFDSLQALIHLTDGNPNDGNDPPAATRWASERKEINGAGLSSNLVSDLTPYSLSAYRGGRYDRGSGQWTPPVPMNEATEWEALLAPLNYQFAHGWGSWINDAIYDYTHDTQVPQRTDYPSPKNVPMFNEIAVNYQLLPPGADGRYRLQLNLEFEFWYPFPSMDNEGSQNFTLLAPTVGCGTYSGEGTPGNWDIFLPLNLTSAGATISILPSSGSAKESKLSVPAQWNNGKPYRPTPGGFHYDIPLRSVSSAGVLPLTGVELNVMSFSLKKPMYLTAAGGNADMLPGGDTTSPMSFSGVQNLPVGTPSPTNSYAVTDPRLNHLAGLWVMEAPSLGEMNDWYTHPVKLKTAGMMSDTAVLNEGLCMYCRNGPMETPAELGFISNGKEWGTIDLCAAQSVELLARLVSTNFYAEWQKNKGVVYTNGTINPNTRSRDVLLSAFYELPANEVPNQQSERFVNSTYQGKTISDEIAIDLADSILDHTDMSKVSVGERLEQSFQFGSDWAGIPAMQQNNKLAQKGFNNNQRESMIRNTWGLFSPDDSLFTVIVVAQAIKEGPSAVGKWDPTDDMVTGERRAVALCWRDPFKTGQNLHHEMFIRMIRYLND